MFHRFSPLFGLLTLAFWLIACLPIPTPTPLHLHISSSALTLSPDNTRLAAVNPDSDSITLIDADTLTVITEAAVGDDPRTVTFTRDGALALVANRGADSVTWVDVNAARAAQEVVVGPQPYGIVADQSRAYVSLWASAEIAVMDLASRAVTKRIAVEPFPAGLALDGSHLYVTHFYTGRVTRIDLTTLNVTSVISTDADANLSQFIALSPDGARAYLPQTRSNTGNRALTYDTTVFPVVSVMDLRAFTYLPEARLDLAVIDQPVSLPFAAALGPDGQTLYVVNAASDDVSVIDLNTSQAITHLTTGHHPRALALSPDGSRLFINDTLDGSLTIFDLTSTLPYSHTLKLTTLPLSPEILTGKRLFNSALPPMAQDHWLACSVCHFDGGHDARTWLGFPDGPRNTPALFGLAEALPLHWSGDLDEIQDVEFTIRDIQGGAGLIAGEAHDKLGSPNAARSADLDALAAYLATLNVPPSPHTIDAEARARGERAFARWGCAVCHTAPLYSDLELHDTPIGDPALERNPRGQFFDTPALLGVWATAPYFHDGSALTLRDTLFSAGFHSMGLAMDAREVEDIVAFMESLP
jgi:YVTN family beta-propeller protein